MYRSAGGGGDRQSWCTREIAALDFLLGIPLENELSIVRAGLEGKEIREHANDDDGEVDVGGVGVGVGVDVGEPGRNLGAIGEVLAEEQKVELVPDGGSGIDVPRQRISTATALSHENGEGWWEKLIQKDTRFFSAADQRMKRQKRLELETGILEQPTEIRGTDDGTAANTVDGTASNVIKRNGSTGALSAMEEGTLPVTTTNTNSNPAMEGFFNHPLLKRRHHSFTSMKMLSTTTTTNNNNSNISRGVAPTSQGQNPGRRLEGIEATTVRIPREATETEHRTKYRNLARSAAVREWESQMTNCHKSKTTSNNNNGSNRNSGGRGLLDGRIFFSSLGSYPINVFSIHPYEPEREAEARRRKQIEESGGGGTQFIIEGRDWRGISYRSLVPRWRSPVEDNDNGGGGAGGEVVLVKKNKAFNRMLKENKKRNLRRLNERRMRRRNKMDTTGNVDGYDEEGLDHLYDYDSSSEEERLDHLRSMRKMKRSKSNDLTLSEDDTSHDDDDDEFDEEDDGDLSTSSSDESTSYVPGFLDDPSMVQGSLRQVMMGNRVTGCVVSSSIQFVRPSDLKADLNKQFRQRFEQWEPPKSQRKFIGAKVVDGVYTLIDPTEVVLPLEKEERENSTNSKDDERHRKGSVAADVEIIRMPPSLTLSKIRSVKQKALQACVRAKLEVSTVALACCYFERLCLQCRVDKTNRRLSFASCLLIAAKINEANVALVHGTEHDGINDKSSKEATAASETKSIKSYIRPTKKHGTIFESLLEFFTHEWSIPLKSLFAAEWGVFAALEFSLHEKPSQVQFHFKRLMKALEWSPLNYLGEEMYNQWQDSLIEESIRKEKRNKRREIRKKKKDKMFLKLQRELQMREEVSSSAIVYNHPSGETPFNIDRFSDRLSSQTQDGKGQTPDERANTVRDLHHSSTPSTPGGTSRRKGGILNRIGLKKTANNVSSLSPNEQDSPEKSDMSRSISTPLMSTEDAPTNWVGH